MQYLKYPVANMRITQNYKGMVSHYNGYSGSPNDYAIDEAGKDSTKSEPFLAPCDMIVKRIYGVNTKGVNTIWLQSLNPVKLANNTESYITMLVMHVDDSDLINIKVGQTYKQGEKIFVEGTDGASGYHFHISVANTTFDKLNNNGWIQNNKGTWVISNNAIKPEDAFYVDDSYTKVISSGGLNFKSLTNSDKTNISNLKYKIGDFVTFSTCYKSSTDPIAKAIPASRMLRNYGTITKINEGSLNPYLLDNGLCWVNDGDIRDIDRSNTYTVVKWDKIFMENNE